MMTTRAGMIAGPKGTMTESNDTRLSSELAALRIDRAQAPPRRGWPLRLALAALALGALALGGRALRSAIVAARDPAPEATAASSLAPAPATASPGSLTATGYAVPQRVARVGAKVQGRIAKTLIREGQAVKAGDLLFVLDASERRAALSAAYARAEAARARARVAGATLGEAKLSFTRTARLAADGASPRASAEDGQARVDTLAASALAADAEARAALAEAAAIAAALPDFEVRAPIDGVATTKSAEVGDVVGPGAVLVELTDFTSLLIETDVPEARLGAVREGAPCEVVLDALPDKPLRGEVAALGPRLNRAKATGLAKIRLVDAAPALRPDMAARVRISP